MSTQQATVLVATDGSWRSGAVLDVAAAEASARGVPLTVVSVVREAADPRSSLSALLQDERRAEELTDWRLREAVSRVRAGHPGLELCARRLTDRDLGWPGEDAGELTDAELLVLGARGAHAEPVFGLGSVSRHLLKVTACPVLVVPDGAPRVPDRPEAHVPPVVAGLGGGPSAPQVLRAALREAALRRTGVLALLGGAGPGALPGLEELVDRTRREGDQDVPVTVRVSPQPPADALRAAGRSASLLVLGTRGPAALAGLAADSVSREVLDAAPCPVLLVVPRVARTVPAPARDRRVQDQRTKDQGPAKAGTTALLSGPPQRRR